MLIFLKHNEALLYTQSCGRDAPRDDTHSNGPKGKWEEREKGGGGGKYQ